MKKASDTIDTPFMVAYAKYLTGCIGRHYKDNYDWRRFGPLRQEPAPLRRRLAAPVLTLLGKAGFVPLASVRQMFKKGFAFVSPHASQLEWLYRHLKDPESRDLLVQIIAFRALGHRHVKLPLNKPEHWKLVEQMEKSTEGCETISSGFMGRNLFRMDLHSLGYPIQLFISPGGVVTQFIDQQYRCNTSKGTIEAENGDIVIDAGGCWADTALYFACKVGNAGKVVSFEFLPDNLQIYQRNLDLNPDLAGRVKLLPHAVWSKSDQELFVNGRGPATSVGATPKSPDAKAVRTLSIDRLVDRGDVNRVDFIKMDIEGAELQALHGAAETLKQFRPKLAITVYHHLRDFWEIPQYLDSLGLGYEFHLRHFKIHAEETVLFARA